MKTITEFDGISLRDAMRFKLALYMTKKRELYLKEIDEKKAAEAASSNNSTKQTQPASADHTTDRDATHNNAAKNKKSTPSAKNPHLSRENQQKQERQKRQLLHEAVERAIEPDIKMFLEKKFQVEGEKLTYLQNALKTVEFRKISLLKRIVVFQIQEGEKPLEYSKKLGDHYYRAEYLAPLRPPQRGRNFFRENKNKRFQKRKRFSKRKSFSKKTTTSSTSK